MAEGGLKLPRAKQLARLVFGEDLEALAGQNTPSTWLATCTVALFCATFFESFVLYHPWL